MRYASVMQLFEGCEAEYQRRHDKLWPELAEHLTAFGISNYYIYLHPETLQLFATFEAPQDFDAQGLAAHPVMQRWWDYMADIMATGDESNAPVAVPLQEVFEFSPLPTRDEVYLVLDIGKTNVKLSAVRECNGQVAATLRTANQVVGTGPYPSADTDAIWSWLLEQLKLMAGRFNVRGIGITTHGATIACMRDGELALPVLDYEYSGIDETRAEYEAIRPAFDETQSPSLPAGLNLGAQLHWLQQRFPNEMAQVDQLLLYPQYWGYRLCANAASEVTSLGCHSDLWQPAEQDFSSLVDRMGWRSLFPALRPNGEVLGQLRPELAEALGLPADCVVFNGIHDSNASLVPHLLRQDSSFAVVSSGTWTIIAGIGSPLSCLDEAKDMLSNINAFAQAVPSIRFMGGREWEALRGQQDACMDDLMSLLDKSIYALPSFAEQGGPFRSRQGSFIGDYEVLTESQKTALACAYLALMTDYGLTQLQQNATIIVEGAFAANALLMTCLASLRPEQKLLGSSDATGTTGGAAMLSCRAQADHWKQTLTQYNPDPNLVEQIQQYRKRWQSLLNS